MLNLKMYYELLFRPDGVFGFLHEFSKPGIKVLDLGCGNDSAFQYKRAFPSIYYVGLDIQDYQNENTGNEDELILCEPGQFSDKIREVSDIDIIISRHNLEHCDDQDEVLAAIADSLKVGGVVFFAFPNENSVNLPSRRATLNYYDDPTHKSQPPNVEQVITTLRNKHFTILKMFDPYRPSLLRLIGTLQEPFSLVTGKVLQGTWSYYGFETIIWAKKLDEKPE